MSQSIKSHDSVPQTNPAMLNTRFHKHMTGLGNNASKLHLEASFSTENSQQDGTLDTSNMIGVSSPANDGHQPTHSTIQDQRALNGFISFQNTPNAIGVDLDANNIRINNQAFLMENMPSSEYNFIRKPVSKLKQALLLELSSRNSYNFTARLMSKHTQQNH